MSEHADDCRLAAEVIAVADERQGLAVTEAARLAVQADEVQQWRSETEGRLAGEVTRLWDRMTWLHEHPRLSRLIGRSAVKVGYKPDYTCDRLMTPLIMEDRVEGEGGHILMHGYVFGLFEESGISIDRAVKDVTTGVQRNKSLYTLTPMNDGDVPRVKVYNKEFEAFAQKARQGIFESYTYENPWASDYEVRSGLQTTYVDHKDARWPLSHRQTAWDEADHPNYRLEMAQMQKELLPRLQQGGGWNYPDELFVVPLQLVSRANDVLGRRK